MDNFMLENRIVVLEQLIEDMREASPYEYEWMERHNKEVEALQAENTRLRQVIEAAGLEALPCA